MLGVHEFADYIVVALVTMFLLLIPVTPMVFWVLYDSPPPSAIGFSGEGFHRWYDSPYDRQLNDDLIPWAEIMVIERRRAGKSSYWALERTPGEVDDPRGLDRRQPEGLDPGVQRTGARAADADGNGAHVPRVSLITALPHRRQP